jgi:hypothetical protein
MRHARLRTRLGTAAVTGACVSTLTVAGYRAGVATGVLAPLPRRSADADPKGPEPLSTAQLLAIVALIGAVHGAGFALLRPLLPARSVPAGVVYSVGTQLILQRASRRLLSLIAVEPRRRRPWEWAADVALGFSLAASERRFAIR